MKFTGHGFRGFGWGSTLALGLVLGLALSMSLAPAGDARAGDARDAWAGDARVAAAPAASAAPPLASTADPLGAAWASAPPAIPPVDAPLFPLSEIKPGLRVVGYTVFEGDRIEPFTGTVKGIARSFLGPQRDVVIVNFEEPRLRHVGIVHGMSGSPIYIGGRILGALSLALSPFPKDALGGVTPLSYMLDEAQETSLATGTAALWVSPAAGTRWHESAGMKDCPHPDPLPSREYRKRGNAGANGASGNLTPPTPLSMNGEGRVRKINGLEAPLHEWRGGGGEVPSLPEGVSGSSLLLPDGLSMGEGGLRPGEGGFFTRGLVPECTGTPVNAPATSASTSASDTLSLSSSSPISAGRLAAAMPMLASGLDSEVVAHFQPGLSAQGWMLRAGGGVAAGGAAGGESPPTPEQVQQAAKSLQAGSGVTGVLVEGDVNLVVTGTVTWRHGDQVLVFGHPFMQQGPISIPMATAEVVATVADETYPYKLANRGITVGAMIADRVTAVVGRMGEAPALLPVTVKVLHDGRTTSHFHYRMLQQRELAPTLFQILVANSIRKEWRYFDEGTYEVKSRITLKGGKVLEMVRGYTFSHAQAGGNVFDIVDDLSRPFSALVGNPFEPLELENVELEVASTRQVNLQSLQYVSVPQSRVRAGEPLDISIGLRTYLGPSRVKPFRVPIPAGMTGTLTLKISDGETLEKKSPVGGEPDLSKATDLQQLLSMLEQGRRADRCYVQLVRKAPGVFVRHQQLTGLPGSVLKVLELASSSELVSVVDQSVVWEGSLPLDGVMLGSQEYELTVLPPR